MICPIAQNQFSKAYSPQLKVGIPNLGTFFEFLQNFINQG